MWAEVLLGGVGCVAVLGVAAFANANFWPEGLADAVRRGARASPMPAGGLQIPTGFPFPIVLLIGVTLVMTFLATRRRFGRYVYAYGGNPDAAELAGINTRWTILKTYVLMGILCALAAAIAAARLNGATLDVGQSYELYVIAAAVVGGTSFAGGIGTIPGAVLGAFVMQSLAYGLSFMGVNSPGQNVVAGIVLILAVGFDTFNRRRSARERQGGRTSDRRSGTPLVEMRDINVAFGGVHAVRDVTIDLHAGEVIGLVGGNGAGKSTLMRVLSGAHPADSGEILIDGKPVDDPQPARRQGATTSRRSTRRSPWPTTSTRRATCSSAAS